MMHEEDLWALENEVWLKVAGHFFARPRSELVPASRRYLGHAHPSSEVGHITYHENLLRWGEKAVGDVVRHELAHILEWQRDQAMSHSAQWRRYAALLGARPRAGGSELDRILRRDRGYADLALEAVQELGTASAGEVWGYWVVEDDWFVGALERKLLTDQLSRLRRQGLLEREDGRYRVAI